MKSLLLACLIFSALTVSAQQTMSIPVPPEVVQAFNRQFPDAGSPVWEQERGNYEVRFQQGDLRLSALFAPGGSWLETEVPIPALTLPDPARDYVATRHAGRIIKEASRIMRADGAVRYEAEVGHRDLVFNGQGKYMGVKREREDAK